MSFFNKIYNKNKPQKKKEVVKISVNIPVELVEYIEEIKDLEFCNTTDVIIDALVEHIKRFKKKKSRLDNKPT